MGEKIPKGWKRCKIKEIGIVVTGTTPSKNNPEFWGNEILFITPSDYKIIINGAIILNVDCLQKEKII